MYSSLGSVGRFWPAAFFAVAILLVPGAGRAQTNCHDIDEATFPNQIFGVGGSAARPLITAFGRALAALPGDERVTVIWHNPGAGHAMHALIGTEQDGVRTRSSLSGTGAFYWGPDGTEYQCNFDADNPVFADFGYMAADPQDVLGYEDIDLADYDIGAFIGPTSGWSLITHIDSNQSVISAEALYLAYRYGDNSQAAPWTSTAHLGGRDYTSAALLIWAAATGLPATAWLGENVITNQAMVNKVATSDNPAASLGFVSSEVADRERSAVKTLAFQAKGQICGFLPDSTSTSFDKKNIRNGHYWAWSYHIFYAPVDGIGVPTNPLVARFFDAITGQENPDVPDNIDIIIENGTIPECAMLVSRSHSYAPLASFAPDEPCGCYYDFGADGVTDCDSCETTEDCAGENQVCRRGFCEEW